MPPCVRAPLTLCMLLTAVWGCQTVHGDCEEDPRARPPDPRIELSLADEVFEAEVANTPDARDRPWAFRRCDLEAVAVYSESRGPYPMALCDVQTEVDLAFVRDDVVVETVKFAPPCTDPCDQCAPYGISQEVDAVVMMLPDLTDFFTGHVIFGLDQVP